MRRLIYAFVANTHSDKPSVELLNDQKRAYSILGLSYDDAIAQLNRICLTRFGITYSENNGMWSEHLLLFSALSILFPQKIKSILEIGTFNGETALILSKLFPHSKITTIDLNNGNLGDIKEYSYAFDSSESNFISNRDRIFELNESIDFIQMNSLNLFKSN